MLMGQMSTVYGMWTLEVLSFMKGQDILLLYKMASLKVQEENLLESMEPESRSSPTQALPSERYSLRPLSASIGLSKSEVSNSMVRGRLIN